jgi:lipopolysaccharide export system permease protein
MKELSAYVFRQVMAPLAAILAALVAIAVLTQGLNQLDIIATRHGSALTFLWVILLTLPEDISLVLPFALLFAVVYVLYRMRTESELAATSAAGVSNRQIVSPILMLSCVAGLAHLAVNVVVQPAAFKELRRALYSVRTDLAAQTFQEGVFTSPEPNVTVYVRERAGAELHGLLIDDARSRLPLTYTARTGTVQLIAGTPTIVMRHGQMQRQRDNGIVEALDFDSYSLPLDNIADDDTAFVLKESDRTLFELFFPDLASHYEQRNIRRYLAEGHARLSTPLLNIALAMLAAAGLLGGELSRRGYAWRVVLTLTCGMIVRLGAIALRAAAVNDASLNPAQYALPLVVSLVAFVALGGGARVKTRRRKAQTTRHGASRGRDPEARGAAAPPVQDWRTESPAWR